MMQKLKSKLLFNSTKCVILFAIVILIAVYAYFQSFLYNTRDLLKENFLIEKTKKLLNVPETILDDIERLKVFDNFVKIPIDNDTLLWIHLKQCNPRIPPTKFSVVFLHGASFSSETWLGLKSLQLAAAMGHRAMAIDLPGWDKSAVIMVDAVKRSKLKETFLKAFLQEMNISRPIIISPSMSGQYSINYIMEPEPVTCAERISGLLALAPAKTDGYTFSQYHRCNVPTLIAFGEYDKHLGLLSTNYLRNMPRSEVMVIEKAGHAWYVEKPEEWRKVLFYFLNIFDLL